ncbi:hypothetical protein DPMN_156405 [Dreissena polymorpha]|uniref:Uncharacterized protein n=1 Tax=Dreissena polymorpha TaxID=45954 RepID=A0A9D4FUC0_DREPO|nr:hypothetical protein DPMN_156405 [Dreissena polymorpha]
MHRWASSELEIGTPFFCCWEPKNPVDKNVIKVYSDAAFHRQLCYVRKEDAIKLGNVFRFVDDAFYFKEKDRPSKFGRKGPMQRCSVGLKVKDCYVNSAREDLSHCFAI